MAKGAAFDNAFLKLIFNNSSIAPLTTLNISVGTKPTLYVALHTSAPSTDDQTSNETSYSGYARIGRLADSANWTIANNAVSPASDITFGSCTSGTAIITNFSIGVASSGTSKILYTGSISPSISISTGISPVLKSTSVITES